MRARLVTIPISHFCEKARWALERAEVDYVEQGHLQGIHAFAARRAGGGRTAPVFVAESGEVVAESSAILRWADRRLEPSRRLYPDGEVGVEAAALEVELDAGLGPDGRLWLYQETLPVADELARWSLVGIPAWERRVFRFGGPLVDLTIRRVLGVDAAAADAAWGRIERVFDAVDAWLADGRRYLVGDRFTAADLTFAALSSPILLPARYGLTLPPLEAMPATMADKVARMRERPAGRFAARLYAEQRPPLG